MTLLAYRYALDPTPAQERALQSHAGAARVAHNWGLARVKANMDQRAAERTYGIQHDDLTPSLSWSLYGLRKAWNAAKDTGGAVVGRGVEGGVQHRPGRPRPRPEELDRLPQREAERAGRSGSPGSSPGARHHPSVRFTTGAIRCEPTARGAAPAGPDHGLPERADLGDARIMSATVRRERGRWHVAFTVEQDLTRPAPTRPGRRRRCRRRDQDTSRWSPAPARRSGAQPAPPGHRAAQVRAPVPGGVPQDRPGPAHRRAAVETGGATRPRPGSAAPRPGGRPAPGRPAQAHHPPRHHLRHGRGRRPQRGRDARQPPAGPAHRRRRVRRDPPPTHLQDRVERRPT